MPRKEPDFSDVKVINIMADGTVLEDIRLAKRDPAALPPIVKRLMAEMLKEKPEAQ